MPDIRIQIPGGALTVQDLRDLVGWAGSARSPGFRLGDSQDLILEAAQEAGPAPARLRQAEKGSLQSSAFGEAPTAALPWLTTGVWMDLLAALPHPGDLDVQLVHEPVSVLFLRHGHLRLTARKAAHQWDVHLRRPGSDRILNPGTAVDTGDIAALIERARDAWASQDHFWTGEVSAPGAPAYVTPQAGREGFHRETSTSFAFGFAPAGLLTTDRLRDLTWLASEAGASRLWLTPGRVLLFEGLPLARRGEWTDWLEKHRLPENHGDLEHAVMTAGTSPSASDARGEVVALLRSRDRMPPSRRLLVADEALNRGDGVCASPYPVLIRTPSTWLFRSGDGQRSGEGSLSEVLEGLETAPASVTPAAPPAAAPQGHRCGACLTVYEPRYGDPQGGIEAGTPFDSLPAGWRCPVCGGTADQYAPLESKIGPMRRLSHGL